MATVAERSAAEPRGRRRPRRGPRWVAAALLLLLAIAAFAEVEGWWTDALNAIPGLGWAVAGFLLLLFALAARDGLAALFSVIVLAVGLAWMPWIFAEEAPAPGTGAPVRIIAWNIHGWDNDPEDRLRFMRFLASYDPDLVALAEAPLNDPEVKEQLRRVFPAATIVSKDQYTVISEFPVIDYAVPEPGGFMRVRLRIQGQPVDLFDVHLESPFVPWKWERRLRQYEALRTAMAASPLALVTNDLNSPWNHPWTRELRSGWRVSNPEGISVPRTLPSIVPITRVDYIFGPPQVVFREYEELLWHERLLGHLGVFSTMYLTPQERRQTRAAR